MTVVSNLILFSIDFVDFISFLYFFLIQYTVFNDQCEKLHQTLERVFHQVTKRLEAG